jgi:hypothetical protein
VLELGGRHEVWAIEIKRSPSTGLQKGNHHALADIAPARSFYIHGGSDRFPLLHDSYLWIAPHPKREFVQFPRAEFVAKADEFKFQIR